MEFITLKKFRSYGLEAINSVKITILISLTKRNKYSVKFVLEQIIIKPNTFTECNHNA